MRGDLKAESELEILQKIIGAGLERDELRDEILVQCMRQATNNPSPEAAEKVRPFVIDLLYEVRQ